MNQNDLNDIYELALDVFNLDAIYVIDLETFYRLVRADGKPSYKINKSLPAYIFHEEFEVMTTAVAVDAGEVVSQSERDGFLRNLVHELKALRAQGKRIGLVAHNTAFDGAILCWRYGLIFDMYFCTKLMRKLLFPYAQGSLRAAALQQWPDDEQMHKGGEELKAVSGIRLKYLPNGLLDALLMYGRQDTRITQQLFAIYLVHIAQRELMDEITLMHITLRARIEPQFVVDRAVLEQRVEMELAEREALFSDLKRGMLETFNITDVSQDTVSSNPQFEQLLKDLSLPVPTKTNAKGKETPAFAKNDPGFLQLQESRPDLAFLWRARIASKSNQGLSRAATILKYADMFQATVDIMNDPLKRDLPFFLAYYGAGQTGRWSGTDLINQQNLGADRTGEGKEGHHRLAHTAPEGYMVSVSDLSAIELRVNLWFCGEAAILERYDDPDYDYYTEVASDTYGEPVPRSDKLRRGVGKATALGYQYGMGAPRYQEYLASGPLGVPPMEVDLSFCRQAKLNYEMRNPNVKAMWEFINTVVIPVIVMGEENESVSFGVGAKCVAMKDKVILPSGRTLWYKNARYEQKPGTYGDAYEVVFDSDKYAKGKPQPKRMWFGLILENAVQAMARDIMADMIVRVERYLYDNRLGWVVGSVHDEILSLILAHIAEQTHNQIQSIMRVPPEWARELPLDCEGGYSPRYDK
jgi:DNA polymerase